MSLIKSISGIRGTIGGAQTDNLTPIDIVKFTAAYAEYVSDGRRVKVVVGRDARLSGMMVRDLVVGTLQGCGVDVIDAGLCTTPGVELAVTHYGAAGGIVLTASHNPRQWNALKLLDHSGEFLSAEAGEKILQLAESSDQDFATVDRLGRVVETVDFTAEHIRRVLALPLVDVEAIRAKKFRVVIDAVNSVGGTVIPALLEQLGCEVVRLNCDPTGEFAHNPEPLPENLTEISARVVAEKADLGVVVDPDVDRLALVCEDGSMFGEEYTLVAVADYVLGKTPGNSVSNLSSTRALKDVTEHHDGEYFAAAVGEVNVVAKMKEVSAVIGGEGNGGVIYPESHYGRDALVGVALFLTHLALTGLSMTALRAYYPEYHISKNKIGGVEGNEGDVDALLEKFATFARQEYPDATITDIDGVKIDFADGWVHLRRSNTEPIIRIYSEAPTRTEADALARKIIDTLK